MRGQDVVGNCWDILPPDMQEDWQELPTDVDNMVGYEWIRDILKPSLISYYKESMRILQRGRDPIRIDSSLKMQDVIVETLGLIEIYFSEFDI
ncbi:hypothetical protein [Paenibacillus illinoisensis]|uniref:hypothetical protein n=1 Tax=Paenibacillus illinoisensis TaxID=59845 RepID=UPI00301A4755